MVPQLFLNVSVWSWSVKDREKMKTVMPRGWDHRRVRGKKSHRPPTHGWQNASLMKPKSSDEFSTFIDSSLPMRFHCKFCRPPRSFEEFIFRDTDVSRSYPASALFASVELHHWAKVQEMGKVMVETVTAPSSLSSSLAFHLIGTSAFSRVPAPATRDLTSFDAKRLQGSSMKIWWSRGARKCGVARATFAATLSCPTLTQRPTSFRRFFFVFFHSCLRPASCDSSKMRPGRRKHLNLDI